MRNKLALFLCGIIISTSTASLPKETISSVSIPNCQDIQIIFARGTGQTLEGQDYQSFKTALVSELQTHSSNLSYNFYELGSAKQNNYQYPASNIPTLELGETYFNADSTNTFNQSIEQGVQELKAYISKTSTNCPSSKYILAGYSQGAMVISKALDQINSDKVLYVANFGDPKLYLPEGQSILGASPKACLGKDLSNYRIYAPNCRTYAGILGAKTPYQTSKYINKIGIWCENKDLMCGAGIDFLNLFHAHTSYASNGHYQSAATVIINKLHNYYPNQVTVSNSSTDRDTVIIIDRTASMERLIDKYKNEALKLARQTLAAGGRVALFTYADLRENDEVRKILDFGCTYEEIFQAITNIKTKNGGDTPESALSGLLTAMNTVRWKYGANKSIILITDAGYHAPDFDGVTIQQVINRSLEIDPVNIYVLTEPEIASEYRELVTATNGKIFTDSTADIENISTRSNLNFSQPTYEGYINEEFTFKLNLEAIEQPSKIEWDLDCDGIYETVTDTLSINKKYTNSTDGFIQARIKNPNGYYSSASARLNITKYDPAEIYNISTSWKDKTVNITYTHKYNTKAVIIKVDHQIIGITTKEKLEIVNLAPNSTIELIAISDSGDFGQIYQVKNHHEQQEVKVPNTGGH